MKSVLIIAIVAVAMIGVMGISTVADHAEISISLIPVNYAFAQYTGNVGSADTTPPKQDVCLINTNWTPYFDARANESVTFTGTLAEAINGSCDELSLIHI